MYYHEIFIVLRQPETNLKMLTVIKIMVCVENDEDVEKIFIL